MLHLIMCASWAVPFLLFCGHGAALESVRAPVPSLTLGAAVARPPAGGALLEAGFVRPPAPGADLVERKRHAVGVDEAHRRVEEVRLGEQQGGFACGGVEEGEEALVAQVFGVGEAEEGCVSGDLSSRIAREAHGKIRQVRQLQRAFDVERLVERLLVAPHDFLERCEVRGVPVGDDAFFEPLERVLFCDKNGRIGEALVVNRQQVLERLLGANHPYEGARRENGRHDGCILSAQVGEFAPGASARIMYARQADDAVCLFVRRHVVVDAER